jgi:hypothetical protein
MKGLTAEDVWAMFAETDRRMKETDRRMKETDRRMKETDRQMKELSEKVFGEMSAKKLQEDEEYRKRMEKKAQDDEEFRKERQETERLVKELTKNVSGISDSNGAFAEDFFYNSLEKNMNFAGVHFDSISDEFGGKIKIDGTIVRDQFDIIMLNDEAIAIIEIKYKAESDYPKKMAEKKIKNFRLLFPYYAKYKIYLGLGSLSFGQKVIQEAKKYGVGLLKQRGETIEFKTDWVRAY